MNKTARILCKLSEGMFAGEWAVKVVSSQGQTVSLFASDTLISKNGSAGEGYLKVGVVSTSKSTSQVLLPVEAFETGSRWITVNRRDLQPA
jgi:hypothetical protein